MTGFIYTLTSETRRFPFIHFPRMSKISIAHTIDRLSRILCEQVSAEHSLRPKVENAKHEAGQWQVRTQDNIFQTENLVVAAGYNREANHSCLARDGFIQGCVPA